MRRIVHILLGLLFVLHTSLVAAAPPCLDCPDMDCPVAQCISAGCLVTPLPPLTAIRAALPAVAIAAPAFDYLGIVPADPLYEVWTPPD